jgi:hypothetical protein
MADVLHLPTISAIGLYMGNMAILQSVNSVQLHTGLLPVRSLLLYRLASFDPNSRQEDKSRASTILWFQAELLGHPRRRKGTSYTQRHYFSPLQAPEEKEKLGLSEHAKEGINITVQLFASKTYWRLPPPSDGPYDV